MIWVKERQTIGLSLFFICFRCFYPKPTLLNAYLYPTSTGTILMFSNKFVKSRPKKMRLSAKLSAQKV